MIIIVRPKNQYNNHQYFEFDFINQKFTSGNLILNSIPLFLLSSKFHHLFGWLNCLPVVNRVNLSSESLYLRETLFHYLSL